MGPKQSSIPPYVERDVNWDSIYRAYTGHDIQNLF